MHEGLDFAAPKGTPIHEASGGVVTEARYVPGYGKLVEVSHGNGLITRYAHASSINVKVGDLVEKGQLLARVGSRQIHGPASALRGAHGRAPPGSDRKSVV